MRLALRILAAYLLLFAAASAGAQKLNVQRLVLSNGLTILALEDHTVPTVAIHTVYKVGSRNERNGLTGLSHLFEHMMFNGSKNYAPQQFDRLIEAGGGYSNAFTTTDTTEFFEEFGSPTLDTVLRLEADRMHYLRLDKQNLEQERGIVKEERRVNFDNSVGGAMDEKLWNIAYVAFAYRWLPIGFMRDIDNITLADAKAYFRTYYAPNNAVMAVVGDFSTPDLFQRVRRYFEPIPQQPRARPVVYDEPAQSGERRVDFHRVAELPASMIAYHIGTFKNPDDPSLDILSVILATGESSRLYRSLVYDKQIATSVGADNDSRIDPGLFVFYTQSQQGHTGAECEQAVYAALDQVQNSGVTDRELQKAKNVLRVSYLNQFKTNSGRASLLAEYEANWGDWRKLLQYLAEHDRVSAADVQRMSKKYFSPDNRTVVTLFPERGVAAPVEQTPPTGGALR